MPIYEFFCEDCNRIFSFFSKSVNTTKQPICPKCKQRTLSRKMSAFAVTGRAKEDEPGDLPFDESRMERAVEALAGQADSLSEDDPRQAADLMRKLSDMTGMELGPGMQEALKRMEDGDDPERVEAEMGDLLEAEEPFLLPGRKAVSSAGKRPPSRDETLYDL